MQDPMMTPKINNNQDIKKNSSETNCAQVVSRDRVADIYGPPEYSILSENMKIIPIKGNLHNADHKFDTPRA